MKTNIQNITIVSRFPLTTYKSEPYSPGLWYTDNLPILFTIHIKKFRHCQTIEVHHFTFWKLLHICIRWRILLLSERLWPKASSGNPPHAWWNPAVSRAGAARSQQGFLFLGHGWGRRLSGKSVSYSTRVPYLEVAIETKQWNFRCTLQILQEETGFSKQSDKRIYSQKSQYCLETELSDWYTLFFSKYLTHCGHSLCHLQDILAVSNGNVEVAGSR